MSKFNKKIEHASLGYDCVITFLKDKTFHTQFNKYEDNWECVYDYQHNLYAFILGDFQTIWFNSTDILQSISENIIEQLYILKNWSEK